MPAPASILNALSVVALLYLPGWAWAWLLRPTSRLDTAASALVLGIPFLLIPAVALAEAGHLSRFALFLTAAVIVIAGLIFGQRDAAREPGPPGARIPWRAGIHGFALLVLATLLCLTWPGRGEWLPGGWDPGVNMNQGLLLARTGRVAQPPQPLLAAALQEAPYAFARTSFGFLEVFPGLPADPVTGALRPYFYRATPTLIAALDLAAGRAAALRVNHVAGLFALLVLAGLLARGLGEAPRRGAILLGVLVLATQPIFVAHLATPASEPLELLLVCSTGYLLLRPRDRRSASALALVIFLAALNRVSFLFHAALLLLVLALWDAPEDDRPGVSARHLAVAAGLTLGLAWYAWVTPDALVKVRHLLPTLHLLAGGSVALALLVDAPLLWNRRGGPSWLRAAAALIPVGLLALECSRHAPWREFLRNLPAWSAYSGAAIAAAALLGLVWKGRRSSAAPWLLWLFICLLAGLLHRHAADLYPWATKRWLAFSPPLLAAGVALLLAGLAQRFGRRGSWAGALLALTGLVLQAPLTRDAWHSTEYDGTRLALERVAAQVRAGDLVVADHFMWGMPLALAHGVQVLNAEPLLAGRGDPAQAQRFLAGQAANGARIVLLASTASGLDGWPAFLRAAQPLGDPVTLALRERIQHRSNRSFECRGKSRLLQLYVWTPEIP